MWKSLLWPSSSTPSCMSKRNENISTQNLGKSVHRFIIYNSPKVETTYMSTSWWTDKQHIAYSLNKVLLINRKEPTTDIGCDMDKNQKHHSKWKKLVTREYWIIPVIGKD
jgi:hypothetical protein